MNEVSPRFWEVFFNVYEHLPRQGPGNRECAKRALAFCEELPAKPAILDMGCGSGGQTLYLAELTDGTIVAVDTHAPGIQRLIDTVAKRGLSERVRPFVADMADTGLPPASVDLVWSEGAFYNLGIERALEISHGLLRPGGYLAFTECVWKKENPPEDVRTYFAEEYPTMGSVGDSLGKIHESGFELLGHFALPDQAWWDDFYTPMQHRLHVLRTDYSGDDEALAALEQIGQEPEFFRVNADYFGYEFFIARRKG